MGTVTVEATSHFDAVLADFQHCGLDVAPVVRWTKHSIARTERNRQQAFVIFPLIANAIAAYPDIPVHMELEAAVDRGDRLIDTFSSCLGVGKRVIRALRHARPSLVGREWFSRPAQLIDAINRIPAEKRPCTNSDWEALWVLWDSLRDDDDYGYCVRQAVAGKSCLLTSHMLAGLCNPGVETSTKRIRRLLGGELGRLAGIRDYFRFVDEWCELTARSFRLERGQSFKFATSLGEELLVRYPAMELIRQAEKWHVEMVGVRMFAADESKSGLPTSWPGLPGLPYQVGELTVCSLTTASELMNEGASLHHCVGNYSRPCMLGDSHIVSIRSRSGVPLSTAEIRVKSDGAGCLVPHVLQHFADRNSSPSKECEAAIATALEMLLASEHQSKLAEIHAYHNEQRDVTEAAVAACDGGLHHDLICRIMSRVLRDYDRVLIWLRERYEEV